MKEDYQDLLRPEVINSIAGLSLISRIIVEGYLTGRNQSRSIGAGLEFSQYRGYGPGDDLRLLDWKMLARSGRYYIKQSEIDSHTSVKFILDASTSMLHTEDGLSKMEFAKVLTACLAHLSERQGDAIGLFALNDRRLQQLRPTVSKKHFQRFLHELVHVDAQGRWPMDTVEFDKVHQRGQKEILFFITDLHEYDDELTNTIKKLKTVRNEVTVLQLMGRREMEFDYTDHILFEDLETGNQVEVDAKTAKSEYLESLSTVLGETKNSLLKQGVGHFLFQMNEPIAESLRQFLIQRNAAA